MASCLTVIQFLISLRARHLSVLVHGKWSKPAAAGIREVLRLSGQQVKARHNWNGSDYFCGRSTRVLAPYTGQKCFYRLN